MKTVNNSEIIEKAYQKAKKEAKSELQKDLLDFHKTALEIIYNPEEYERAKKRAKEDLKEALLRLKDFTKAYEREKDNYLRDYALDFIIERYFHKFTPEVIFNCNKLKEFFNKNFEYCESCGLFIEEEEFHSLNKSYNNGTFLSEEEYDKIDEIREAMENDDFCSFDYEDYFVPTEYYCSECNYQRYLDF